VAVFRSKLDLAKALEGADLAGTLVFINRSSGIVFNAYLRRVYASSQTAPTAAGTSGSFTAAAVHST
jgi:hypothetical protein